MSIKDSISGAIEDMVIEITKNKEGIIEEFMKTYVASRWDKYFSKKNPDLSRLKLIIERTSDPFITKYYFEVKRGRAKNKFIKKSNENH